MSDDDMRYNQTKTDPDKVAVLAADIYEMVRARDMLIVEQILAGYVALTFLTRNCGCLGCACGDEAHSRASHELRSPIVDAAIKLFDLELDARGL